MSAGEVFCETGAERARLVEDSMATLGDLFVNISNDEQVTPKKLPVTPVLSVLQELNFELAMVGNSAVLDTDEGISYLCRFDCSGCSGKVEMDVDGNKVSVAFPPECPNVANYR